MNDFSSPVTYYFLGVADIGMGLHKNIQRSVKNKMNAVEREAKHAFNQWLEEEGLENSMGVIRKKDRWLGEYDTGIR